MERLPRINCNCGLPTAPGAVPGSPNRRSMFNESKEGMEVHLMKPFDTCVGIDLARRAPHKAVLIQENGAGRTGPKKAWAFSHDLDGLQALRDRVLKQTGAASLEGVAVNLEPTSGVWETVGAFLKSQGAEVYFTRPDVVS